VAKALNLSLQHGISADSHMERITKFGFNRNKVAIAKRGLADNFLPAF